MTVAQEQQKGRMIELDTKSVPNFPSLTSPHQKVVWNFVSEPVSCKRAKCAPLSLSVGSLVGRGAGEELLTTSLVLINLVSSLCLQT
jgi:hypothetical protein